MYKKSLTAFASFITLFLTGGLLPALAQSTSTLPSPVTTPQGVLNIICEFAVYFFYTVIIVTVIMVVWASFLYVTAGEDTEKTTTARRTLTYAAVGVAVSLLAVGFPTIIEGLVGSSSGQTSLAPHCTILGGSSS